MGGTGSGIITCIDHRNDKEKDGDGDQDFYESKTKLTRERFHGEFPSVTEVLSVI